MVFEIEKPGCRKLGTETFCDQAIFIGTYMRYIKTISIILLLVIFVICPIGNALATFTLSVTPYEGGYDLRYGKVDPVIGWANKELRININSDIGKQYRLIQMLIEPLTNSEGNRIDRENFKVYALRGSNRYGSLSVENEISVRFGREIIYTSNQAGTSDSFDLVYKLIVGPDQASGSYRGRISYILEPIDSTEGSVIVNLNIYADIESEREINIKTTLGTRRIELEASGRDECDVLVDITGAFGRRFRISQLVSEPLRDASGKELPYEAVEFKVEGASKGSTNVAEYTPLTFRQDLIYTSGPRGEADDFVIFYILNESDGLKAGKYTTGIRYILEGGGSVEDGLIETLALEVEIPTIFDIIIKPETGGSIEFRDLKPLKPSKLNEVAIEIETNTGKPYQVSQNLLAELTNPEGDIISPDNFTLKIEGGDSGGTLKFAKKTPVKTGESVLFVSNSEGDPDSFKAIYELDVPLNIRSGNYSTRITYSISEI